MYCCTSQLEVRGLARLTPEAVPLYRSSTEGATMNAVHMAASPSGGEQLFVCNNDSTIKVYRLPDMHRLTTIRCQVMRGRVEMGVRVPLFYA